MMFQVQEPSNNTTDITIDNVIDMAIANLEATKNQVSAFRSKQESLANEKDDLMVAIDTLREEKTRLAIDIEKIKVELSKAANKKNIDNNNNMIKNPAQTQNFFDNQNDGDDDSITSVATAVTVSTTSTTRTSLSSSSTKKRRVQKAYNSPKKWRRMIRTQRLQSIFFN